MKGLAAQSLPDVVTPTFVGVTDRPASHLASRVRVAAIFGHA
jgi:hypothetical protein